MILADTSVWIDYFRAQGDIYRLLSEKLERLEVWSTEFVFGELLQGGRSKSELNRIRSLWAYVPKIRVEEIWIKAGEYASAHHLPQKGIGLIDSALIVSAIESRSKLWTLDRKLRSFLQKEHPSFIV